MRIACLSLPQREYGGFKPSHSLFVHQEFFAFKCRPIIMRVASPKTVYVQIMSLPVNSHAIDANINPHASDIKPPIIQNPIFVFCKKNRAKKTTRPMTIAIAGWTSRSPWETRPATSPMAMLSNRMMCQRKVRQWYILLTEHH